MELAERNAAMLFAQQQILAVLVITHPDPASFAKLLEHGVALSIVEWAQNGRASPDALQAARDIFQEMIGIATDEAQRRSATPGRTPS